MIRLCFRLMTSFHYRRHPVNYRSLCVSRWSRTAWCARDFWTFDLLFWVAESGSPRDIRRAVALAWCHMQSQFGQPHFTTCHLFLFWQVVECSCSTITTFVSLLRTSFNRTTPPNLLCELNYCDTFASHIPQRLSTNDVSIIA